jgi:orotate phosphoribosyltransferase
MKTANEFTAYGLADGQGMDRETLAARMAATCWLRGQFHLRSGGVSDVYFDKYRFESDPALLSAVAEHLLPLVPTDCEVLAGIELGGIPISTALSLTSGLPVCFVRKTAKSYGTGQFAEGLDIRARKLVLIEDVVSTGGQIVDSARMLRNGGAIVTHVLAVLVRHARARENLAAAGLQLSGLFTAEEVPAPAA